MFISFDLFLEHSSNKIVISAGTYLCRTTDHTTIYVTGRMTHLSKRNEIPHGSTFSKCN